MDRVSTQKLRSFWTSLERHSQEDLSQTTPIAIPNQPYASSSADNLLSPAYSSAPSSLLHNNTHQLLRQRSSHLSLRSETPAVSIKENYFVQYDQKHRSSSTSSTSSNQQQHHQSLRTRHSTESFASGNSTGSDHHAPYYYPPIYGQPSAPPLPPKSTIIHRHHYLPPPPQKHYQPPIRYHPRPPPKPVRPMSAEQQQTYLEQQMAYHRQKQIYDDQQKQQQLLQHQQQQYYYSQPNGSSSTISTTSSIPAVAPPSPTKSALKTATTQYQKTIQEESSLSKKPSIFRRGSLGRLLGPRAIDSPKKSKKNVTFVKESPQIIQYEAPSPDLSFASDASTSSTNTSAEYHEAQEYDLEAPQTSFASAGYNDDSSDDSMSNVPVLEPPEMVSPTLMSIQQHQQSLEEALASSPPQSSSSPTRADSLRRPLPIVPQQSQEGSPYATKYPNLFPQDSPTTPVASPTRTRLAHQRHIRSPSQAENRIKEEYQPQLQTPSQQTRWNSPTNENDRQYSGFKIEEDTDDAQSTPAIGYHTPSELTSPENGYTPESQMQNGSLTPGSHYYYTPKQEPRDSPPRIKQEEHMEFTPQIKQEPVDSTIPASSSPTPSTRPRFSFEPEDAEEHGHVTIKQEENNDPGLPMLPTAPSLPEPTTARPAFAMYPTITESPATTVDSEQLLRENHFGFGSPLNGTGEAHEQDEEEDDEYALNPMVLPPLRNMSLSRHGSLLESQRQISTQIHVVGNSASPESSHHSLLLADHRSASSSTDDFARQSVSERRRSLMDEWKRNSLQGALPAPDLLRESVVLNRESEWTDTDDDYHAEEDRSPTIKTEDEDDPDATFQRPSPSSPVTSPITSPAPMALAASTPTTARVSSTSSPLAASGAAVHQKIPKSLSAMFATAVAYAAAIKSTKSPKSALKTPMIVSPESNSPPVNPERASTVMVSSKENSQTSLVRSPEESSLQSTPLPAPSPYLHKHVDSTATDFVFEPADGSSSTAPHTPRLSDHDDQSNHLTTHNIATAITTPSITDIPSIMGTPQTPVRVKQESLDHHEYTQMISPQARSSPHEPHIKTEPVDSSPAAHHALATESTTALSCSTPPPPIKSEPLSTLLSPEVFFSDPLASPSVTSPSSFASPSSPYNDHDTSEEEEEEQDDTGAEGETYNQGIPGTPTYKRSLVPSESQHRLWSPSTPRSPALDSENGDSHTTGFVGPSGPSGLVSTRYSYSDTLDSPASSTAITASPMLASASPHPQHSLLESPGGSELRQHRPWAPVYIPGTRMALDEEREPEIKQEREDGNTLAEEQASAPVAEPEHMQETTELPYSLSHGFESPIRKRRYTPWAPEASSPSKLSADDSFAAAARLPVELPVDYPDIHADEHSHEPESTSFEDEKSLGVPPAETQNQDNLPVEPAVNFPETDTLVSASHAEPAAETHTLLESLNDSNPSTDSSIPAQFEMSTPVNVSTPVKELTPIGSPAPVTAVTSVDISTPTPLSSLSPAQSPGVLTPTRTSAVQSPAKTPETFTPEQSIVESPKHLSVRLPGAPSPALAPEIEFSPTSAESVTPRSQHPSLSPLETSQVASPLSPSTPPTLKQTKLASPFDRSSRLTNEEVLVSPTVEIKQESRDDATPSLATKQTPVASEKSNPADKTHTAEAPENNSWDDIAPALAASLTYTLADEEEQARAATPSKTDKYAYKSLDPGSPAQNSKFGIPEEPLSASSEALLSRPLVHRRSRSAGDVDRVLFENQVAASLGSVLDFDFDGSSENLPLPPMAPFSMGPRPASSSAEFGRPESTSSLTTDENASIYRTPDEQSEVSDHSDVPSSSSLSQHKDYDYENEATIEESPEPKAPETIQTLLPKNIDSPSTAILISPPESSSVPSTPDDESTTSPVSVDRPAAVVDNSPSAAAAASAVTTASGSTTAPAEPHTPAPFPQLPDLAEYSLSLDSSMSEFPIFDATNSAAVTEALLSAQRSASGKAIFFPHHGRGLSADLPVIEPLKIETTALNYSSFPASSSVMKTTVPEENEEEEDQNQDQDAEKTRMASLEVSDKELSELHLPVPEIVFTPAPELDSESVSDTVQPTPGIKQEEEPPGEPCTERDIELKVEDVPEPEVKHEDEYVYQATPEPQVKHEDEYVYTATPEPVIKQEEHEPAIKQEEPLVDLVPVDEGVQTEQKPVDEGVQTEQEQAAVGCVLPPDLSVIKEESREFSSSQEDIAASKAPQAVDNEPVPQSGPETFPLTPLDALPTSASGSLQTSASQELSAVLDQVSIKQEPMSFDRKCSIAESAHSDTSYDTQPLNINKRSSQHSSVGELGYKDADAYDAMLPDAHASNEDDGFFEEEDEEEEELQDEPSIVAADSSLKVRRSLAPEDVARFSFSSKMLRESSKASGLSHSRKASLSFANEEPFPSYFHESSLTDPSNYPLAAAAATAAAISSPYTPRARAFSGQSARSARSFSGSRYQPLLGTTLQPSSAAGATAGTSTGASATGGRSFSSASHNESLGLTPPVVSKNQDELAPPLLLFDIDDVAFDSESIFNDLNKEFDRMLQSENTSPKKDSPEDKRHGYHVRENNDLVVASAHSKPHTPGGISSPPSSGVSAAAAHSDLRRKVSGQVLNHVPSRLTVNSPPSVTPTTPTYKHMHSPQPPRSEGSYVRGRGPAATSTATRSPKEHPLPTPGTPEPYRKTSQAFGDDRGRLFIRILGIKNIEGLPDIESKNAKVGMVLDNGLHSVTTPFKPLHQKSTSINQEFELVVGGNLEFILTLKAKWPKVEEHYIPQQPPQSQYPGPSANSAVSGKRIGLAKLFSRNKEEKRRSPQYAHTILQNKTSMSTIASGTSSLRSYGSQYSRAHGDTWSNYMAQDGSFGRAYVSFAQFEPDVYGTPRSYEIPCYNEWTVIPTYPGMGGHAPEPLRSVSGSSQQTSYSLSRRKTPYPIAMLECQMLFIPRGAKSEPLPSSIKSAAAELDFVRTQIQLKAAYEREEKRLEEEAKMVPGTIIKSNLSQLGGDCKHWRCRYFKLNSTTLTAFSETSHKPRAAINLKKAVKVIDDQGALVEPMTIVSAHSGRTHHRRSAFADHDLGSMHVAEGFRLKFSNGEIIDFYAESVSAKERWVAELRRVIAKYKENAVADDDKRQKLRELRKQRRHFTVKPWMEQVFAAEQEEAETSSSPYYYEK